MNSEPFLADPAVKRILSAWHGLLKPLGFKKRRGVFVREVNGMIHGIEMQRSQWSSKSDIEIFINFGLHSKAVEAILQTPYPRRSEFDVVCMHAYSRLVFGPHGRQSLGVNSEDAARLATEESLLHIETLVLPIFESANTDKGLYDLCLLDQSVSPITIWPRMRAGLLDALRQVLAEG